MEKKINHSSDKLEKQDKPGFHRASDKQHALSENEKKESREKLSDKKPKGNN